MDCVWLERTEAGLVAELAAGERVHLPVSIVEGSVPLSTSYASAEVSDRMKLQLSCASMRAWNSFRTQPDAPHDADTLVLVAEASIYLGDQATLEQLRSLLAAHVSDGIEKALDCASASEQATTQPRPRPAPLLPSQYMASGCKGQATQQQCLQHRSLSRPQLMLVLQALPEHEAVLLLRAALAELRGREANRVWHSSRSLGSDFRAAAIDAAMEMLPRHLRPLVLRAVDPAVDASRSVTLSRTTLEVTDRILRAGAASSAGVTIEALTLQDMELCDEDPEQGCSYGLPSPGPERELARDALTPLRMMTSLIDFSLSAAVGDWTSVRLKSLVGVLRSVLPSLPQLTRLSLRRIPPGKAGAPDHLSALSTLCALRELDLSYCRIGGDRGLGSPVRNLAIALRMLGALTHLDLLYTWIGSTGWAVVREGICSSGMRLRVLGLGRCTYDCAFWLLPESAAAPPEATATLQPQRRPPACHRGVLEHGERTEASDAALEGLLCLRLGGNQVSVSALCAALGQLSCLTCIHIPGFADEKGDTGSDTRLAAALSHCGTSRLRELSWDLDVRSGDTAGMRSVLERWSQLRKLSIRRIWTAHTREGDVSASLVEVLPHLPQLQSLALTPVTATDVAPLSAAVALCSALTGLSLSWDSRVSYEAVSNRVETMLAKLTALQRLEISCTHREGSAALAAAVVGGLLPLTCMTSLSLSELQFPAAAVPSLTRALDGMHALDTLALVGCKIGGNDITGLLHVIARMPVLRVLSMWTAAEPEGFVDQWAQQLPGMAALEDLHLKAARPLRGMLTRHAGPALRCLRC